MIEDTLRLSEADYSRRFADLGFGRDLAEVVAERCRLPRPLARKVEGSSLVFRAGEGPWVKISPPFFGDAFETEVMVTRHVQGRLPAAVPDVLDTGELGDWRYLVSAHVPGVQIQTVLATLSEADLEALAAELGGFMRAFHAIVIPGFERVFGPWPVYLDDWLRDAQARNLARGADAAWVRQILEFVRPHEAWLRALEPVLVHADLTAEHIMLTDEGGRWRLSGVLDLADSMTAPAALDAVAPFLELFRGRRAPQRRLLAAAGVDLGAEGQAFSDRFMALALQHRFMHLREAFKPELARGMTRLQDIAASAFPS